MDSSDHRKSVPPAPTFFHRLPLLHPHHHIQLSPHCPLHAGHILHPNSHQHRHSAAVSPNCPLHGYFLPHCPLHSPNFHSSNQPTTSFPIFPNFAPPIPPPRNLQFSNPNVDNLISVPNEADHNSKSDPLIMQERDVELEEEEDEEEIIFVLTDEWKEFFAKSEAKRRLEKKQAKKKGKD